MSTLLSRTIILTISRVSNFAIQILSPLLLVRILDVSSYGQYQEFMIYATLLVTVCAFGIDASLTYFIPRNPEQEKSFVVQTSLMTLGISIVAVVLMLACRELLREVTSYDFVLPLAAYVFFFVNLSWVEYLLIAKRRARTVLLYSAARLLLRVTVLLFVAYETRDIWAILWSLSSAEAIRVLVVFIYFARKGMFRAGVSLEAIKEQWRFAAPVGLSGVLQSVGRSIGKMFVASTLGPAAVAYYAVGSYLQPMVRVLRGGIQDAVYPDLVRAQKSGVGALRLWQRVNVLNCVLFFPIFVIVLLFSKQIVETLFTKAYLPAVPIFNIYAFFLVRRCFNADVLLRTAGRTGFMMFGTIGALAANVAMLVPLTRMFGLSGPAVAFILAECLLEAFYTQRAAKKLNVGIAELVDWRNIVKVAVACIIVAPVPALIAYLLGDSIIGVAVGALLYFAITAALAHWLGVEDIGRIARAVTSWFGGRLSR
jgi:O-antigen/teichoic acid export membrane protein